VGPVACLRHQVRRATATTIAVTARDPAKDETPFDLIQVAVEFTSSGLIRPLLGVYLGLSAGKSRHGRCSTPWLSAYR
jgi:hypothetical protein